MAAALAGNHAVLGLGRLHMKGSWPGPNGHAPAALLPGVALTFDDGPDPEVTPRPRPCQTPPTAGHAPSASARERNGTRARAPRSGTVATASNHSQPPEQLLVEGRAMRREVAANRAALAGVTGERPSLPRTGRHPEPVAGIPRRRAAPSRLVDGEARAS
ncbi:MAG: hypothetical protein R2712_20655 [Vicinamibacterales bacterium]